MSGQLPQSRSWRRALVLHAICLGCFDAGHGLRRVFSISRIRDEGLDIGGCERCPNGLPVWHRRGRDERPQST